MARCLPVFSVLLGVLFISACSSSSSSSSPAIEGYLEALVAKDTIGAVNRACLAWEENARAEGSSFEAVEARLELIACSEIGEQNDFKIVACEGSIIANYGGEDQDIDLADRNYLAIFEDNEWKMCGYVSE